MCPCLDRQVFLAATVLIRAVPCLWKGAKQAVLAPPRLGRSVGAARGMSPFPQPGLSTRAPRARSHHGEEAQCFCWFWRRGLGRVVRWLRGQGAGQGAPGSTPGTQSSPHPTVWVPTYPRTAPHLSRALDNLHLNVIGKRKMFWRHRLGSGPWHPHLHTKPLPSPQPAKPNTVQPLSSPWPKWPPTYSGRGTGSTSARVSHPLGILLSTPWLAWK